MTGASIRHRKTQSDNGRSGIVDEVVLEPQKGPLSLRTRHALCRRGTTRIDASEPKWPGATTIIMQTLLDPPCYNRLRHGSSVTLENMRTAARIWPSSCVHSPRVRASNQR